jgi:hypothetical protein
LVRINADEIRSPPNRRYMLNVTVTNVGERTAENLQVSLNQWVDTPQTIDNLLPGESSVIAFSFILPSSVTDQLRAQVLYKGTAIALETIPVTIELPDYSLSLVDQNGSYFTVLVVNNEGKDARRIDFEYSVSKDGETFVYDTMRNIDLAAGTVSEKYVRLPLRSLPAGTYEVKGTFYEQGRRLADTESSVIIESDTVSFDMKYLFYGLLAVIIIVSGMVFYSTVKKR